MNTRRSRERGAALLEYVLLLSLIALIGVAGLRSAGPAVGSAFEDAGRALDGETGLVVESPVDRAIPSSVGVRFPGGGHAGGGKGKK
jgi:Flp pilus assembly pilin Flp